MPLRGQAYWPGVSSVTAAEYTLSHGTQPGVIHLAIGPRSTPAMVGDFRFTDGEREFIIPRCKVDNPQTRKTQSGTITDLYLLDQRWRWRECGNLREVYNQVDDDGEPLPYMKKTPYELAEICLRKMGVVQYQIILPNVTILPPISWNNVTPASALEALVVSLGCRVCYNPFNGAVLIAPMGVGVALPTGHISEESIALDLPERPDAIHCVGQAVRFQGRFKCRPMALEFNGEYVPLNEASYRPALQDVAVHKVGLYPGAGLGGILVGDVFTVRLDDIEFSFTATATTIANVVAGLKAEIDLAPQLPYRATVDGDSLLVEGTGDGTPFDVATSTETTAGSPVLEWDLITQGVQARDDPWGQVPPYTMATVQATERLNKREAIDRALASVFRVYEVTIETPEVGATGTVRIPDYSGPIVRKEQFVLQQTRAEQIEPYFEERDANGNPIVEFDENGRSKRNLFYDGHSRDKPAVCYGSYFHCYGKRINTSAESEIQVPFSINPKLQLVTFSKPVYTMTPGVIAAAEVILEVAFNLRDAFTNGLICIEDSRTFPEPHFGTDALTIVREDIQATQIAVYDDNHRLISAISDNFIEARAKLAYYIDQYARQFEVTAAQSRTFAGIHLFELDGAIQQITWRVGSGSTTTISRNSEHSKIPFNRYPMRQQRAAMDPISKGKKGSNPPFQGKEGGGAPGMIDLWEPSQGKIGGPR